MKVEQYVMAYEAQQDRIRAILPETFNSLRPVMRINAEIRDDKTAYVEFNTPVEKDGIKGWINIGFWNDFKFERALGKVNFKSDFLNIFFTPVGIEGSCPNEKDNEGCYYIKEFKTFKPAEQIKVSKEFCDCSFKWSFSANDAQGESQGKTLPAYFAPVKVIYPKEQFTSENAAKIPCIQVLGAYVVKFER